LGYRWELRGKKIAIVDVKGNVEVVLDKVRFMSLMKFLPNCLDKIRIEEKKVLRTKLSRSSEKSRKGREKSRARIKGTQARASKKVDKMEKRLKKVEARLEKLRPKRKRRSVEK